MAKVDLAHAPSPRQRVVPDLSERAEHWGVSMTSCATDSGVRLSGLRWLAGG